MTRPARFLRDPEPGDLITIGNGQEVHRVTEVVERDGRLVANAHSVSTKLPQAWIPLHEIAVIL